MQAWQIRATQARKTWTVQMEDPAGNSSSGMEFFPSPAVPVRLRPGRQRASCLASNNLWQASDNFGKASGRRWCSFFAEPADPNFRSQTTLKLRESGGWVSYSGVRAGPDCQRGSQLSSHAVVRAEAHAAYEQHESFAGEPCIRFDFCGRRSSPRCRNGGRSERTALEHHTAWRNARVAGVVGH